jgi:two-component system OmpR family sensor kinase
VLDSVRARLTLWYVGILGAMLIAFSGIVYGLLTQALHERVDESLDALVNVAEVSLTHDAAEGQSIEDAAVSTVNELSNRQQALAIFDERLEPLAVKLVDEDITPSLPREERILERRPRFFTVTEPGDDDDAIRVAVRQVEILPARTIYVVMASQSLEDVLDELESLQRILMWSIPVGLLIAAVGGWALARHTLRPVVSMADQARRIGASHLDRRLPIANERDELGRLALTFNELLDRLSRAFHLQRQFMADASHELRTPLMAIRSAADVTLQRETREPQEYRAALALVAEQGRRLSRLVDDMFTLARADAGHAPLQKRMFYLDELTDEIARAGSQIGSARRVSVAVEHGGETPFYADEELVRRMLTNLVDNAVRYSPDGGTVRVALACDDRSCRIAISDNGPGIPAAAQPHIFDRFYRADPSRVQDQEGKGAGLGLAISRWIAEAHGGAVALERSGPDGSTFVVTLPVIARPPA